MSDCSLPGTWTHGGPAASGYYEVRPCPKAWEFDTEAEYRVPGPRVTYVDIATGRFDAGKFGGDIAEPLWEWRGPISVPDRLPADL